MTNYPQQSPPAPPPKSNAKWWILGGCGCVLLLVVTAAVILTMFYFIGHRMERRHHRMFDDRAPISDTTSSDSQPELDPSPAGFTGGQMFRGTFHSEDGSTSITFSTNGTFERTSGDKGTYYLNGHTLDLSPANGAAESHQINASGYASETPELIEIDGKRYRLAS